MRGNQPNWQDGEHHVEYNSVLIMKKEGEIQMNIFLYKYMCVYIYLSPKYKHTHKQEYTQF